MRPDRSSGATEPRRWRHSCPWLVRMRKRLKHPGPSRPLSIPNKASCAQKPARHARISRQRRSFACQPPRDLAGPCSRGTCPSVFVDIGSAVAGGAAALGEEIDLVGDDLAAVALDAVLAFPLVIVDAHPASCQSAPLASVHLSVARHLDSIYRRHPSTGGMSG